MELEQGIREVIFMDATSEKRDEKKQKQLKVCAYCRVSTESDEQATSYEAQQKYYKDKINENPNWRLIEIYGEEVSGTRADKRPEFMKMIRKCRKKKIDLVITKSLSRFARNTIDSLKYIRELKELGIGIYFEKENINTLDTKSEVIITILSSLAQEESNSISGNIKMGMRMRMKDGKVNFRVVYGFTLDEEKNPVIIPIQAEIVTQIFKDYLTGHSTTKILATLNYKKIPSPTGKDTWNIATIQHILENEKYCGDVLMQKTYVDDPISKKVLKNDGDLPKVLVRNNHKPIISREMYDMAQTEKARRSSKHKISKVTKTEQGKFSSQFALTEILVCGECNSPYRRTTWSRNKRIVWRCISRLENGKKYCENSITIDENIIHQAIVNALNITKDSRQMLITYLSNQVKLAYSQRDNGTEEIIRIENQIIDLNKTTMEIIQESISQGTSTAEYTDRLVEINNQMKKLESTLMQLKKTVASHSTINLKLEQAKQGLAEMGNGMTEYNDSIVRQSIDIIKILDNDRLHIIFKDGFEYEQSLSGKIIENRQTA